ncbi:hypothetical protein N8611_00625 [bacterium]|nr:hypothetical protein [bacterium]
MIDGAGRETGQRFQECHGDRLLRSEIAVAGPVRFALLENSQIFWGSGVNG